MKEFYGYWIHHCEPPCGLGTFDYECPNCESEVSSCDLWWHHDANWEFSFECEKCGSKLRTYFDPEELEQYVVLDDFKSVEPDG